LPRHRLEEAIGEATDRFIDEVTDLLRQAKLNDLMALGREVPAPAVQAEEPRDEEPAPEPLAAASNETRKTTSEDPATPRKNTPTAPRKTRTWPTCSTPGCTGKMYGPSGSKRLCYRHHLEVGGKPSPLTRKRSKAGEAELGPQAAGEARQGAGAGPDGLSAGGLRRAVESPGIGLRAKDEHGVVQHPERAPVGAETTVVAQTSKPSTPAPRRSIKDIRRSAVDPSVFVRGKGANGRSRGTEPVAGGLGQAEALFDIPGTGRGR